MTMTKRILYFTCLLALLAALLYPASQYRQHEALSNRQAVQSLTQWTWQQTAEDAVPLTLPHTFEDLSARTSIVLTTTVEHPGDYLLIKSVYAPFRLYVNGLLTYTSGTPDKYPEFFLDPPTLLQLIPLPENADSASLRLEFFSPVQRGELRLPVIETGDKADLLLPIFQQSGVSFVLSLLLLFLSLLPITAAFLLRCKREIAQAFLQLGLFAIAIGLWGFGECNLTVFFLPYPSLLYLMAFIGLFAFTIPLLKFGLCILGLPNSRLLRLQIYLLQFSLLAALLLQRTGLLGFAQSVYFFHFLIPVSLSVFSLQICWAAWKHKNAMARRFALPLLLLPSSALLELLNYQLRFTNILSLFFQIGSLLFILSLGILAARFVHESINMRIEKKQLEFDLRLTERQTEVQRRQYAILTEHERILREQRHDLRHQLIVLKSYSLQGDHESLQRYIDELNANLPVEKDCFICANFVVNSVALYFQAMAKQQNIQIDFQLTAVAAKNGSIRDSDLCIILGNLLENAIEACGYLPPEQRRIALKSRIFAKKLLLVMENSYDGFYCRKDGIFYSRKRKDKGNGLSSIESVAQSYHGLVEFLPEKDVFLSSVYLELN